MIDCRLSMLLVLMQLMGCSSKGRPTTAASIPDREVTLQGFVATAYDVEGVKAIIAAREAVVHEENEAWLAGVSLTLFADPSTNVASSERITLFTEQAVAKLDGTAVRTLRPVVLVDNRGRFVLADSARYSDESRQVVFPEGAALVHAKGLLTAKFVELDLTSGTYRGTAVRCRWRSHRFQERNTPH